MDRINCPLCNNKNYKTILKKDDLSKYYHLVKCKDCGLVFINPLPTEEDLNRYYNIEYAVPEYQKIKLIKKANKILSLLSKYGLSSDAKILEIGASHGFFLNEAKKQGFVPYGVELSEKACNNAKKYFGINIENVDFLQSSFINKKEYFDVVVLLDVLEHLTNQNEILNGINTVLKRKGILVLTLPNIDSWEFKICGKYWEWLSPPAHLFYYSPDSIEKMLKKHGFDMVYLETYYGDTAGNILFHIYLSFKQFLFYNLKYIVGKKKLLKIRENIRDNLRNETSKEGKEFVGIDSIVFKLCNILWKPFNSVDNWRCKKGKGPSILVIAVKK
ncbi:class I SAM-dependent methyltransferase [Methanothermococcus okinawensis]|uniref:Methyltransferase type 11 n=1 Tax=Methanothermococcus okinawensis (strain DSM 14208 / JCM 11175 / IH1) TaxID=647113 RepID=F8AMK8_METOI|nr:class I SAM-dependent methyltransferase [Methanothermococcus okinawensis]AEH06049.1 Methyltransferase type 11 [Methanothermococcus okinawensis IH1]